MPAAGRNLVKLLVNACLLLLAGLVGAMVAYPASPDAWLGALSWVGGLLVVFGLIAYWWIAQISKLAMTLAKRPENAVSRNLSLIVLALASGASGWMMANAFKMADDHLAGSEFVSLGLIIYWFWLVVAVVILRHVLASRATSVKPR